MELLDQSKHPRGDEGPNPNDISYGEIMKWRSPYEKKMGRIISSCTKCHGEGKVRVPLSKKARAMRKVRRDSTSFGGATLGQQTPSFPPPMKPCSVCEGTGLIAAHPTSASQGTKVGEEAGGLKPSPLSVAIVGGGIGGIALAAALQHRNIPCVVYERDTSFEERKQGYGLTMQQGARALRSLGLFALSDDDDDDDDDDDEEEKEEEGSDGVSNPRAQFGIHSTRHVVHKPCGTVVGEWGMKIWGGRFEKNGRKHAKRQNAHISRQNLRKMLMEMLRPGTIRWGHMLTGYSRGIECDDSSDDNLNLKLTFRRRRSACQNWGEECDDEIATSATVLVGCDGIRSVVRAKKLGDELAPLRYLGCIVILGIAASPNSSLTDGETVFQTADGITRLYAMPYAPVGEDVSTIAGGILDCPTKHRGLSMWQLSFPMDEGESKRLSKLGPSALKAEALKRCGQWHDPIPALLSLTPEDLITGYPCYDRATVGKEFFRAGCKAPQTASADPFVTMLGDAAHPMSPFKGELLFLVFMVSFSNFR
jgi:salicylate hydroxylase